MKKLVRMLIVAFGLGLLHATPARAAATDNFCVKLGDYYDSSGGWHVVECYNDLGNDQWLIETYYIKHGTDFQVVYMQ